MFDLEVLAHALQHWQQGSAAGGDVFGVQDALYVVAVTGDRTLWVAEHPIPLARELDAVEVRLPVEESLATILERDLQDARVGLEGGDVGIGAHHVTCAAVGATLGELAAHQEMHIAAVDQAHALFDFVMLGFTTQVGDDGVTHALDIVAMGMVQHALAADLAAAGGMRGASYPKAGLGQDVTVGLPFPQSDLATSERDAQALLTSVQRALECYYRVVSAQRDERTLGGGAGHPLDTRGDHFDGAVAHAQADRSGHRAQGRAIAIQMAIASRAFNKLHDLKPAATDGVDITPTEQGAGRVVDVLYALQGVDDYQGIGAGVKGREQ